MAYHFQPKFYWTRIDFLGFIAVRRDYEKIACNDFAKLVTENPFLALTFTDGVQLSAARIDLYDRLEKLFHIQPEITWQELITELTNDLLYRTKFVDSYSMHSKNTMIRAEAVAQSELITYLTSSQTEQGFRS